MVNPATEEQVTFAHDADTSESIRHKFQAAREVHFFTIATCFTHSLTLT